MTTANVSVLQPGISVASTYGSRPIVNSKTGQVFINTPRGLRILSALRKDEWEELDTAVVNAAVKPLNVVSRLESAGLVRRFGGLGTLMAQYNKVSEMTEADVSLRAHSSSEKGRVDFSLASVPVPLIYKEYELDARELESARLLGNTFDTAHAEAAARVVGEKIEQIAISGYSGAALNGQTIYGLTNHPDRNADTAANFGGGDWGTITNVLPTISGMISAVKADNYYGPYGIFVASTQYNQATMSYFTDGSGDTPADRIMRIPNVSFFEEAPWLADGNVLLVTLSTEVVQIGFVPSYWPITNLEWSSGDGMALMFKVLSAFTIIVKSDYSGKSGIAHATGA